MCQQIGIYYQIRPIVIVISQDRNWLLSADGRPHGEHHPRPALHFRAGAEQLLQEEGNPGGAPPPHPPQPDATRGPADHRFPAQRREQKVPVRPWHDATRVAVA